LEPARKTFIPFRFTGPFQHLAALPATFCRIPIVNPSKIHGSPEFLAAGHRFASSKHPLRNQVGDARQYRLSMHTLTKERSFFTVHSTFVLSKSCHD